MLGNICQHGGLKLLQAAPSWRWQRAAVWKSRNWSWGFRLKLLTPNSKLEMPNHCN